MARHRGGHFGAFTARQADDWLRNMGLERDVSIDPPGRGHPRCYRVNDKYRPGQSYDGPTPITALRAAGFCVIKGV